MQRLGDEFLARPALPDDQNRKRRGGDLFDLPVHGADRLGGAPKPAERPPLAKLGAKPPVLVDQLPRARELLEEDLQLRGFDGFLEEILGAELDRFNRGLDGPLPRKNDDRNRVPLFQAPDELQAVDSGHDEVGDDSARGLALDADESLVSGRRGFRFVSPGLQEPSQPLSGPGFVIHNEDAIAHENTLESGGRSLTRPPVDDHVRTTCPVAD